MQVVSLHDMQKVCSANLTQSGTVFFDPCEAFEFVSDDDSDPSIISTDEEVEVCGHSSSTRISPRNAPFQDPRAQDRRSSPPAHMARSVFGNMNVVSATASARTLNDDQIRMQTLKQRIEAFDEITTSKISTGSITEVLPVSDSLPPPPRMKATSNVERRPSIWRKPLLLSCVRGCPKLVDSSSPRSPATEPARKSKSGINSLQSTKSAPNSRGGFGILRLAKRFVDFRLRGSRTDLDKVTSRLNREKNHQIGWQPSREGRHDPAFGHGLPRPPTRSSADTRRLTMSHSVLPTMPTVGASSAGAAQRGICDSWDCLMQTRALRRQALDQCGPRNRTTKPHFGEYRRKNGSQLYQTWHGDVCEASTPVQRRNADVMQSLSEINVAREHIPMEYEGRKSWDIDMTMVKEEEQEVLKDVSSGGGDEHDCADSLHPQIPVTPASIFTESDNNWDNLDDEDLEDEDEMTWLGDEPPRRKEKSAVVPVLKQVDDSGPLEQYRSDRLMPQDPMLSQKLLFDTLFETCASFSVESKSSGEQATCQPSPPESSMPSIDSVNPVYGSDCQRLAGCWRRDPALSDVPEDVCDAGTLNSLVRKSGKHSNHLKIEVQSECVAVTGQILGGFDHTQVLHFSAKGHDVQRCDGRPGSMKMWIETIPNGFRERNSWGAPQAGAKMDEYEVSEDGQKLVITTHVTFKMGRNCRLRSVFKRIGSSCRSPFN